MAESIDISLNDIPEDIATVLKQYVQKKYPGMHVNLYISPLIDFKIEDLPWELSSTILEHSNIGSKRLLINKNIGNKSLKYIYNKECQYPPSVEEIMYQIETNSNIVISREILTNHTYINTGPYKIGTEERKHKYREVYLYTSFHFNHWNSTISIYEQESSELISNVNSKYHWKEKNVDLFTMYEILNLRESCIKYDALYADQYLVNEYNIKYSKIYEGDIVIQDILDILIANIIANKIDDSIPVLVGEFDVSEDEWNKFFVYIIEIYYRSIDAIRAKIIKLTGATEIIEDNIVTLSLS